MVNADRRTACLLWLIEHHPDSDVFQIGSLVTSAFSNWTGLNSAADSERAKSLWTQQVDRFATNPMVLSNAATVFGGRRGLELIKRLRALEPGNPEWLDWLGQVYAASIRSSFSDGITMVGASSGSPKHSGFRLSLDETVVAKRELEESADAALLSKTAEDLLQEIARIKSIGLDNSETRSSEAYANQLMIRAQDPNRNVKR
jgi:hypothetical protein